MGTIGIQLGAKGATLVTAILFARALGPEEFGRYGFVMSIITLAALPTVAGLPQLLVREISQYTLYGQNALLSGLLKWSNRYVLLISMFSIIIIYTLAVLNLWDEAVKALILSAFLLIPLKGGLSRQGAVINGFHRPELAQLPTLVLAPIFALLVSSWLYFYTSEDLTSQKLVYIQIFAHISAAFLGIMIVNLVTRQSVAITTPIYRIKKWHKALLPFTIITVVGTMNSELTTVMLGFFGFEESIGYFRVAVTGMTVLALSLTAVNSVSGPKIASLYKQKNLDETQNVLTQSVRLSVMTSVPLAGFLILFGEYFISFLFGKEYIPAASILSILCVGQIVNVSMGSVGLVLNMTGNEKFALRAQLFNLVLMIGLLVTLVPFYQGIGAAIAVSSGMVFWNLLMAYDVYRLTGLKTWIRF
ncbi:oligosaccharide flippase family protein [Alteromonas sp.]|uniref:oligosaccharide flippase family protein n=1 Tax=Alteromonas sp. TaxID=232 RepID=UPI00257C5789|nr:oligosaccharide flippase family protein [Alteromonas sp.]NQY17008.1 oligosaccharide flippase family protein [Alteromonas sp.]